MECSLDFDACFPHVPQPPFNCDLKISINKFECFKNAISTQLPSKYDAISKNFTMWTRSNKSFNEFCKEEHKTIPPR